MPARIERLRQMMAEKDLPGLLVSSLSNCRYLSGFTGEDSWLLITQSKAAIAVDPRFVELATRECPDLELVNVRSGMPDWFLPFATQSGVLRWAVEANSMTLATYQGLTERIARDRSQVQLVPTANLIENLRMTKGPSELGSIERAARLADEAFQYAATELCAGMTEKELAWLIERFLRENGSGPVPFEIIIASGPNASLPHARPSARPIQPGEPLLIDMGARIDGYCSDFSRTICAGVPDPQLIKIHDIVLGAQLAALATIRAGMTGAEADQLARTVIAQAGHEQAFGHGLGHGVGLDIHEWPRLGARSTDVLTVGMVFSVEPGIYLPGWGGVRIEDTVVLEEKGARPLTRASKLLSQSQPC